MLRRSMALALALTLSACDDGPAGPPDGSENDSAATLRITGAETGEWDGTSVFHVGTDPETGRVEFSLTLNGRGDAGNEYVVIYGQGRPEVGTYALGLFDAPYHAFNARGVDGGTGTALYAADRGELVITRSSPERVEGTFHYGAFLYCRATADLQEGPCSIPDEPIEGAPRIEVAGEFSAIAYDQVPITEVVVPATIDFYHYRVVIEVPASVWRGEAIEILVRSYGGGCTSFERTDVSVVGRTVTVEPMNREVRGRPCTEQLVVIDHTATVTFDSPGTVTVVVKGLKEPGDEVVTFERGVMVR